MPKPAFPDGHFYSPVIDADEIEADRTRIWQTHDLPGVDLRLGTHADLLIDTFPQLLEGFRYPEDGAPDSELDHFYENNSQFANLDPRVLFCMMKLVHPRRIVEVGSGYSTLLMMDVNERFFGGNIEITSIEPYPRPFLKVASDKGRIKLIQSKVQHVDVFGTLESGDILFIDSSHVSKTGSDVNYLILQILPRLNPGVYVHIHDIFLPNDYPYDWVVREQRSWNEQYLLQAFLHCNDEFAIVFGVRIAIHTFPTQCQALAGTRKSLGASFWMRRKRKGVMGAVDYLSLWKGKFRRALRRQFPRLG